MPSRELTAAEQREAEQNARQLKATEATVLALLLAAIKEVVDKAARRGLSPEAIAPVLTSAVHSAILKSRRLARTAGRARLVAEAHALGVVVSNQLSELTALSDSSRASLLALRHGRRWLEAVRKAALQRQAKKLVALDADDADGSTTGTSAQPAPLVVVASKATLSAIERIAATETAQAFSAEREIAARQTQGLLFKRWDATLDVDTCPFCKDADGTIVELHERFPQGEPGDVHPWCRCTWLLVK